MKNLYHILLLLFVLSFSTQVLSQTQYGCVKTRGKMVDGKHVPGKGLPGAIVSIQNQTDVGVKNSNGFFSFPVADNHYCLEAVTKKNYTLVDADAVPRTYAYSTDTLYLVMETPEKQLQDKLEIERKIRRTLQRQLQNREEEIEALKARNQISQQEYQKALQELYDAQEKNEHLISEMAKRYSQIDYDQIEEFYRQVSFYIEHGDLVKAYSLLRSRGDVVRQVEAHLKDGGVIRQKEKDLQQAKEVYQYNQKELANRCYSYYESFKMQHQDDSAAHYIELRARIDTTNIQWQFDAGYLGKFQNCEVYYNRVINLVKDSKNSNLKHLFLYATTMNNLGSFYERKGEMKRAEFAYKKGLEGRKLYADLVLYPSEKNHAAWVLVNLGAFYLKQNRFSEAEQYLKEAENIYQKIRYAYYDKSTKHAYGRLYNQLGYYYLTTEKYVESEKYYQKSWNEYAESVVNLPEEFLATMSYILEYGLKPLYGKLNRLSDYETYYSELDSLYKCFNPQSETAYWNYLEFLERGVSFYANSEQWDSCIKIKDRILTVLPSVKMNSDEENVYIETTLMDIAWFKVKQEKIEEAISLVKSVEESLRKTVASDSTKEDLYISSIMILSECYSLNNEYQKAYDLLADLLPCLKRKFQEIGTSEYKDYYVNAVGGQAYYCMFMRQYKEAEQYAREGLEIDDTKTWIYTNLAASLLFQGKFSEAERIYRQFKEVLKDAFLNDFKLFEEADVIPKERMRDVETIKWMLNE